MSEPTIFDSSNRPVIPVPSRGLRFAKLLWTWIGIPGLTLAVLILQTCVFQRQSEIMSQQTKLLAQDAEITETQRKLASRPNIVTTVHEDNGDQWNIANKGPYAARDLRARILHFKKFVGIGWQDTISNEFQLLDTLQPGGTTSVYLSGYFRPFTITEKSGKDYPTVLGSEFYVVTLSFERDLDDKRYLYLQPFDTFPGRGPRQLRMDLTAMSGPVAKNCSMDAYAVELTYEFFKRNPLPYPIEPYNYHYLIGEPRSTCLQSGPSSLRW